MSAAASSHGRWHAILHDEALAPFPRAMMLSFADPAPLARRARDAGVPLFCQVHTLDQALHALDVGANVVVAQGTEAGGHGQVARSTMPFVPAVADAVSRRAPDVLVLAAGGIADGRGSCGGVDVGRGRRPDGNPLLGNAGSNHPLRGKDEGPLQRRAMRQSVPGFTTSCAGTTGRKVTPDGS
jgi:hypothetical protein